MWFPGSQTHSMTETRKPETGNKQKTFYSRKRVGNKHNYQKTAQ